MPGYSGKPLNEKTTGEIIAMIIAFLVIGSFMIAVNLLLMAHSHWDLFAVVWNSIGILIVSAGWLVSLPAAFRELRKRRTRP